MQAAFERALSPPVTACLGFRLRPLTVGHVLLIERACPDMLSGKDVKPSSLFATVLICSQPWREAEKSLGMRWLRLFAFLWGYRVRKLKFADEIDRLTRYLRDSMTPPEYMVQEDGKRMNSPWSIRLVANLMGELNMSLDAALEVPISLAHGLLIARLDAKTDIELWSDEQEQFLNAATASMGN
jgi:hypothetical protein